jgi:hypothetical protein
MTRSTVGCSLFTTRLEDDLIVMLGEPGNLLYFVELPPRFLTQIRFPWPCRRFMTSLLELYRLFWSTTVVLYLLYLVLEPLLCFYHRDQIHEDTDFKWPRTRSEWSLCTRGRQSELVSRIDPSWWLTFLLTETNSVLQVKTDKKMVIIIETILFWRWRNSRVSANARWWWVSSRLPCSVVEGTPGHQEVWQGQEELYCFYPTFILLTLA